MNTKPALGWRELASRTSTGSRILVVDDDQRTRRGLEKLISSMGYDQVKVAGSAEEADHWMTSLEFDLVLLDIELPRMNGVEFLSWALDRNPTLATIMLTGLDNPDLAIKCLRAGARNYLVKPISAEFLEAAIRDALAVREVLVERNRLIATGLV